MKRNFSFLFILISIFSYSQIEEKKLDELIQNTLKTFDVPGMSVGIIKEIPEEGIIEVAHPIGVIAAITPATGPTVTSLGNFLHAVKGKNALGGAAIGQLEHLRKHWLKSLLETRSYNARVRQAKPACSHFVTRIFRKIPAAQ